MRVCARAHTLTHTHACVRAHRSVRRLRKDMRTRMRESRAEARRRHARLLSLVRSGRKIPTKQQLSGPDRPIFRHDEYKKMYDVFQEALNLGA